MGSGQNRIKYGKIEYSCIEPDRGHWIGCFGLWCCDGYCFVSDIYRPCIRVDRDQLQYFYKDGIRVIKITWQLLGDLYSDVNEKIIEEVVQWLLTHRWELASFEYIGRALKQWLPSPLLDIAVAKLSQLHPDIGLFGFSQVK